MRFVVFIDLFATFVQPATVLYVIYLIYASVSGLENFPMLTIILIGAIYGLQGIFVKTNHLSVNFYNSKRMATHSLAYHLYISNACLFV